MTNVLDWPHCVILSNTARAKEFAAFKRSFIYLSMAQSQREGCRFGWEPGRNRARRPAIDAPDCTGMQRMDIQRVSNDNYQIIIHALFLSSRFIKYLRNKHIQIETYHDLRRMIIRQGDFVFSDAKVPLIGLCSAL